MFSSLQAIEAGKADENTSCDTKRRQCDAEKCEDQLSGGTKDHADDTADRESPVVATLRRLPASSSEVRRKNSGVLAIGFMMAKKRM